MRGGEREPVITIDGPAGAGKSTVARALARRLGYRLLDTGAMYRALAWSVARAGLAAEDTPALQRHLDSITISVRDDRVSVDGHDVTADIRTPEIGELTSRLSMFAPVRMKIVPLQREVARAGGVVLEGRDTGTVVCPDAEVKFYLDASLEERARRRHAELAASGASVTLPTVAADIAARDAQDQSRELAPLRQAPDATVIDSTGLSVPQVVERMQKVVERQCCTRS